MLHCESRRQLWHKWKLWRPLYSISANSDTSLWKTCSLDRQHRYAEASAALYSRASSSRLPAVGSRSGRCVGPPCMTAGSRTTHPGQNTVTEATHLTHVWLQETQISFYLLQMIVWNHCLLQGEKLFVIKAVCCKEKSDCQLLVARKKWWS